MEAVKMFEVGGCVRDELLGLPTKDVDFACEAGSFDALLAHLELEGFKVWQVRPQFTTVRAQVPNGHPLLSRTKDADFVLCRKDVGSSDGRHPDRVEPGTLLEDLARRDFTVNAMAKDPFTGALVDPHGGAADLAARSLRFVGDAMERVREDGLRVARGFRFQVTKGLQAERATAAVLTSEAAARMLGAVSKERRQEELDKMFGFDPFAAHELWRTLPTFTQEALLADGVRVTGGATLARKK